jgi:hypothetical protein
MSDDEKGKEEEEEEEGGDEKEEEEVRTLFFPWNRSDGTAGRMRRRLLR